MGKRQQWTPIYGGPPPHMYVASRVDGWPVTAGFAEQKGRLVIAWLAVHSPEGDLPAGGVDADLLRRISTRGAIQAALAEAEEYYPETPFVFDPQATARLVSGWRPAGARALGTDFYARVAADHLDAYRADHRRPHEWLAAKYRRTRMNVLRDANAALVRGWVYEARHRYGFLKATSRGRSRPEPTQKLKVWMADQGRDLRKGRRK